MRSTDSMFKQGAGRSLFFSTTAFAVSFAVWGLISALAPTFTQAYQLSATEKSLMIALPVLLGSLGRLPAGMLADRYGGRRIFAAMLVLAAIPAALIGLSTSYTQLLVLGLFLGLAGTTFPVGVGFTSKWFSSEKQGSALGVYGMGNIGQSIAVFGAPVLASALGAWRPVFFIFAVLSLIWGIVFYLFARDAAQTAKPKTLAENLSVLKRSPLAWVLSLFYFLTFGGFVALAIYLPTLLIDQFALTPTDAGARTAGFVLLATLMRPLGGWLAEPEGRCARVAVRFCVDCRFRFLDELRMDADLYHRRARRRCRARFGQRRGLQTRAAVFPERDRDGDGTRRRVRRTWRILPAARPRCAPRRDRFLHTWFRLPRAFCLDVSRCQLPCSHQAQGWRERIKRCFQPASRTLIYEHDKTVLFPFPRAALLLRASARPRAEANPHAFE